MDYVDKTALVGSCYRLITTGKQVAYDAAYNLCYWDGAELLVIDNEVEQEIVASMLAEVNPKWTFYTDFTRKSGFYWSGKDEDTKFSEFLFVTRHGESIHEVGYAPWQENKREVGFKDKVCIIVNASNGMYTESNLAEYYLGDRSFAFCEIRVPKPPPF